MGSRVYDNDTNISTVTDSRIGVADNASYVGDGSTVTITNNSVDAVVMQNLLTTTGAIALGAFTSSHDLLKEAARISNEANDAARRTSADAIALADSSSRAVINASRDQLQISTDAVRRSATDAYAFATSVNNGFLAATRDLNDVIGNEGEENRAFATGLVGEVLARSQSADSQNYEKTLSLLKWIAAAVAVAFVAPYISKGVRA